MAGLVVVIFIIGIATAIWYSNLTTTKAAWDEAARMMHFQRMGVSGTSVGTIVGERQGVRITTSKVSKNSGDNNETFTRYFCEFPSVGPPVSLTKQHSFSFIGKLFGQSDVLIGDPGFDDRVVISTNAPQQVDAFLTPGRKMAILNLFESHSTAKVTERSIQVDVRGVEKTPAKIVSMSRWLTDFAVFISKPSDVDIALQNQAEGNLGQAVAQLHEINEQAGPEGPNSFTQLLEAEGKMAMGDGVGAAEILDHMDVIANKEAMGLREVAHKYPTPPTPPPSAVPPTPPAVIHDHAAADDPHDQPMVEHEPEPVGIDLEQQAVINDLFSSHRTGYEVEEHFMETYIGHVVSWSGPVTRTMKYRFDSEFEGEGIKANIEIGTLDNGQLISNTVSAIVQLDEHNEIERDQHITVLGTLHRVDRYMRNIYVRDAEII